MSSFQPKTYHQTNYPQVTGRYDRQAKDLRPIRWIFPNAIYTKEIVTTQGMKNLILVSSPYYQRRVYETFRSVFKGTNIRLQNNPSKYSNWREGTWWKLKEIYI